METTRFIEPLDVLFLRGNKLFGDAGSYGESMIPPRPSVAAGALRSAILARDGVDIAAFATGEERARHPALGTPANPGPFRVLDFQLAWHGAKGDGKAECLYPLPADLVAVHDDSGHLRLDQISPRTLPPGLHSSKATTLLPVLAQAERAKPQSGYWLTQSGMQAWLRGGLPKIEKHLLESRHLWAGDERVGIALDPEARRAGDGKLFSMQGAAFRKGVGFAVRFAEETLTDGTLLRFGGDGRGAVLRQWTGRPLSVETDRIATDRRCRIILTSPGLFPAGWRLPGVAEDGRFELQGVRGRVVCAAVPRAEVVSGWDLAQWAPKPAQRAAPAGSVYWIDELEATSEALGKLADHGLWPETGYDSQRRVEGFNRFTFASY